MIGAGPPIPAHSLPSAAVAPGKCIVFGEHAVVHGAPELLFAIDLTTQVGAKEATAFSLNADPDAHRSHPYFRTVLERTWAGGPPLEVRATSRIPRGAGLGSSAAFCAAAIAVLAAARGEIARPALAQASFEAERGAQGVGSAGDTSTVVAGGFVAINTGTGRPIWSVRTPDRSWEVRRVEDPGWIWVVAHSGIPRSTADAVRAVGERLAQPDGHALLRRFSETASAGIDALARADRAEVARRMAENQELLRTVGVSHPRLEALLEAARPVSDGAKITGAGAGGSIVVLPTAGRETELVRRLARAGGLPFVVRPAREGVSLVA